jgi:uncharacterized membrane protein
MNTPILPEKTCIGVDANIAAVLAYVLGFVSGLAFLLMEKDNKYVRFHAMQSVLLFATVTILNVTLSIVPILGALAAAFVVWPSTVIIWLFLMYKAFSGERFKLPILGDFAEQQIG